MCIFDTYLCCDISPGQFFANLCILEFKFSDIKICWIGNEYRDDVDLYALQCIFLCCIILFALNLHCRAMVLSTAKYCFFTAVTPLLLRWPDSKVQTAVTSTHARQQRNIFKEKNYLILSEFVWTLILLYHKTAQPWSDVCMIAIW